MKNVSDAVQKSLIEGCDIVDKVYIYLQAKIDEVVSPSEFYVAGKAGNIASELIADSDTVVFILADINTEYRIGGFSIEVTTEARSKIILYDNILDESYVGKFVQFKRQVSDKVLDKGIGFQKLAIEGDKLNSFDSGYMNISFSNDGNYFRGHNPQGLFDYADECWLSHAIKIKGQPDEYRLFTGLIDLRKINPDYYAQIIQCNAYGLTYELERYPAFSLMNKDSEYFPLISGIKINSFNRSEKTTRGKKQISYIAFGKSYLEGITIDSVQRNHKSGIKLLEFRYPNQFRWDSGSWITVDSNPTDGLLKIQGNTHYAILKIGDNDNLIDFPDRDDFTHVLVKPEDESFNNKNVVNQGKPRIIFDEGKEEVLSTEIQRVLVQSGSSYLEITDKAREITEWYDILGSDSDVVYFINPDRFWGIEFDLSIVFNSSDYEISYSVGGEVFSEDFKNDSGFTDGTNGLTQSGLMKWNSLEFWADNNIILSSGDSLKGFIIKITRITAAGTCRIKRIKRLVRALGQDEDSIDLSFDIKILHDSDAEDYLLVNENEGVWSYGTNYNLVSSETILNRLLEESNYDSDSEFNNLVISNSYPTMNIWGKVPSFTNVDRPYAHYVDFDNNYIYISSALVVYRCEIGTSEWVRLFDVNGQEGSITNTTIPEIEVYSRVILRMEIGDGKLWVLASYLSNFRGMYIQAFSYNLSTSELIFENDEYTAYIGDKTQRQGNYRYDEGTGGTGTDRRYRWIGQSDVGTDKKYGENLCIPFNQALTCDDITHLVSLYPTADLLSNNLLDVHDWQYNNNPTREDEGSLFWSGSGFYYVQVNGQDDFFIREYNIPISYGQEGAILVDGYKMYAFKKYVDDETDSLQYVNLLDNSKLFLIKRATHNDIPISIAYDDNGYVYFAFTQFRETEGLTSHSLSYISKTKQSDKTWKSIIAETTGGDVNYTASINSGTSEPNMLSNNGESIVIGHSNKIKTFKVTTNDSTPTYEIRYSKAGDTWELYDDMFTPRSFMNSGISKLITIDMPDSWAEHSIYGFAIKITLISGVTTDVGIIDLSSNEQIVWDSGNEVNTEQTQMVINMAYHPVSNSLIGCSFNRSAIADYPFQWSLFTLDLDTLNMTWRRTADNFTFDGTISYKNFTLNTDSGNMYLYSDNLRYQDSPGFLAEITYNGSEYTLNRIESPRESDYSSVNRMFYNNYKLFGITAGNEGILWEYSNEYHPVIEFLNYNESDNLKTALTEICEVFNFYFFILPERFISIKKRNNYRGDYKIEFDDMVTNKPNFSNYEHYYDATNVKWDNELTGLSGFQKTGSDSWGNKILSLDNHLIQNKFLAKILANDIFDFFNYYRMLIKNIKIPYLFFLENMDRIELFIPKKVVKLDRNVKYILFSMVYNMDRTITISLLEIRN